MIGAGPWGGTLARTFARIRASTCAGSATSTRRAGRRPARRTPRRGSRPPSTRCWPIPTSRRPSWPSIRPATTASGCACSRPTATCWSKSRWRSRSPTPTALRDAADGAGRVLTVGHLLLHHPAVRRARQLIDDGRARRPALLRGGAHRAGDRAPARQRLVDARPPRRLAGAAPLRRRSRRRSRAVGSRREAPAQDVVAFATLHFADGRLAHLHAARFAAAREQRRFSSSARGASLTFDELARGHRPPLRRARRAATRHGRPRDVPIDVGDPLLAQCRALRLLRRAR